MSEIEKEPKKRRTSITKLQRQTAVAAELIALCQTVTEDGHLEEQEIDALRQWLNENSGSDLPAVAFLTKTVQEILADGKVTADERHALYHAIETVLPSDIRESVRGSRLSRERLSKVQAREQRESERQADNKLRARFVDRWDFMVAGCTFEGRDRTIQRFAEPGHTVSLVRDRANKFSRNAVEIRLSNGMQIGYVPEEHAVDVAPLLDHGYTHKAHIKKILAGRRAPIPVVVASLYEPTGDNAETRERVITTIPSSTASKKKVGYFGVIVALVVVAFAVWILWTN